MFSCEVCKTNPSNTSIKLLLSSLGRRPRRQRSSKAITLCSSCIQRLTDLNSPRIPTSLIRAVNAAYGLLTSDLGNGAANTSRAREVDQ